MGVVSCSIQTHRVKQVLHLLKRAVATVLEIRQVGIKVGSDSDRHAVSNLQRDAEEMLGFSPAAHAVEQATSHKCLAVHPPTHQIRC